MTLHRPTVAVLLLLAACGGDGRRLEPARGERGTGGASATANEPTDPDGPVRDGPGRDDPVQDEPAQDGAEPATTHEILIAHNRLREQHCAPPLVWSSELAETAQSWADRVARRCRLEHSDLPHGENLYMGTSGVRSPAGVAEQWHSEVADYDFRRGGFSMETGHFTQLVWASTRSVGCGMSSCNGLDVWVCMYDPPGNVQGGYRDNVKPSSCD